MVRGCGLLMLALYGLQCLAGAAAIWHKYDNRAYEEYRLSLYYTPGAKVSMFVPGIGALFVMMHWASWGTELEMLKAVDITLPDGRQYTLTSEDFTTLDQLGIHETPEGIQLTDAQGQPLADTPPISPSCFEK